MLIYMRTTIRLNDELLSRAKREASVRGITLSAVIEQALLLMLYASSKPNMQKALVVVELPVCRAGGGTLPDVDLNNSKDLVDRIEDRIDRTK